MKTKRTFKTIMTTLVLVTGPSGARAVNTNQEQPMIGLPLTKPVA